MESKKFDRGFRSFFEHLWDRGHAIGDVGPNIGTRTPGVETEGLIEGGSLERVGEVHIYIDSPKRVPVVKIALGVAGVIAVGAGVALGAREIAKRIRKRPT